MTTDILPIQGLTLSSVEKTADSLIVFKTTCGKTFHMTHFQDCCEDVHIDDICGDLEDLVGTPVLSATEEYQNGENAHSTWTFYRITTLNGTVVIKWFGESNGGYYSETADFYEIKD